MPKVTIIADDKAVYVDGEPVFGVDLSTLDPTIHAVQWDGVRGEIEFSCQVCPTCHGVSKKPNQTITDFSSFQSFVVARSAVVAAVEAEAAAAAAAEAAKQATPPTGGVNVVAN